MSRTIEIVITPQGETTVTTQGYAGSDCLAASRFLEQTLGEVTRDQRTAEYHAGTAQQQHVEQ